MSSHWQKDRERGPKLTGGISRDKSRQNLEADLVFNHTKWRMRIMWLPQLVLRFFRFLESIKAKYPLFSIRKQSIGKSSNTIFY